MRRSVIAFLITLLAVQPSRQHTRHHLPHPSTIYFRTSPQATHHCDGTLAQDSMDVSGNFVFNQRRPHHPRFRTTGRACHGTIVTTTEYLSLTHQHSSPQHQMHDRRQRRRHHHHHRISRFRSSPFLYDTDGNFVLKDPGQFGSPSTSTTNALPATPTTTFSSTARSWSARRSTCNSSHFSNCGDFCADLVEFTS